jgi:hypothetical protein
MSGLLIGVFLTKRSGSREVSKDRYIHTDTTIEQFVSWCTFCRSSKVLIMGHTVQGPHSTYLPQNGGWHKVEGQSPWGMKRTSPAARQGVDAGQTSTDPVLLRPHSTTNLSRRSFSHLHVCSITRKVNERHAWEVAMTNRENERFASATSDRRHQPALTYPTKKYGKLTGGHTVEAVCRQVPIARSLPECAKIER